MKTITFPFASGSENKCFYMQKEWENSLPMQFFLLNWLVLSAAQFFGSFRAFFMSVHNACWLRVVFWEVWLKAWGRLAFSIKRALRENQIKIVNICDTSYSELAGKSSQLNNNNNNNTSNNNWSTKKNNNINQTNQNNFEVPPTHGKGNNDETDEGRNQNENGSDAPSGRINANATAAAVTAATAADPLRAVWPRDPLGEDDEETVDDEYEYGASAPPSCQQWGHGRLEKIMFGGIVCLIRYGKILIFGSRDESTETGSTERYSYKKVIYHL